MWSLSQSTCVEYRYHELVVDRVPIVVCITLTVHLHSKSSMVVSFGTIDPKTSSVKCESCFSIRNVIRGERR